MSRRRLYPLFLRLMERYLISFQLDDLSPDQRATHSLVPLLLPFDRPREMLNSHPTYETWLPGNDAASGKS